MTFCSTCGRESENLRYCSIECRRKRGYPSLEEYQKRFWNRVVKSGDDDCWTWIGSVTKKGYGQFTIGGRTFGASYLMYLWMIGEVPKGLYILHHCDNPACVNPKHLFLGTNSDNMRDMYAKGRGNNGNPLWRKKIGRIVKERHASRK